ncbi:hypothetical protein ACFL2K_02590 [Candidatus Margulisiibacteriota bacterium]
MKSRQSKIKVYLIEIKNLKKEFEKPISNKNQTISLIVKGLRIKQIKNRQQVLKDEHLGECSRKLNFSKKETKLLNDIIGFQYLVDAEYFKENMQNIKQEYINVLMQEIEKIYKDIGINNKYYFFKGLLFNAVEINITNYKKHVTGKANGGCTKIFICGKIKEVLKFPDTNKGIEIEEAFSKEIIKALYQRFIIIENKFMVKNKSFFVKKSSLPVSEKYGSVDEFCQPLLFGHKQEVIKTYLQSLKAVYLMHEKGFIHGDLKFDNFLDKKIIDLDLFGKIGKKCNLEGSCGFGTHLLNLSPLVANEKISHSNNKKIGHKLNRNDENWPLFWLFGQLYFKEHFKKYHEGKEYCWFNMPVSEYLFDTIPQDERQKVIKLLKEKNIIDENGFFSKEVGSKRKKLCLNGVEINLGDYNKYHELLYKFYTFSKVGSQGAPGKLAGLFNNNLGDIAYNYKQIKNFHHPILKKYFKNDKTVNLILELANPKQEVKLIDVIRAIEGELLQEEVKVPKNAKEAFHSFIDDKTKNSIKTIGKELLSEIINGLGAENLETKRDGSLMLIRWILRKQKELGMQKLTSMPDITKKIKEFRETKNIKVLISGLQEMLGNFSKVYEKSTSGNINKISTLNQYFLRVLSSITEILIELKMDPKLKSTEWSVYDIAAKFLNEVRHGQFSQEYTIKAKILQAKKTGYFIFKQHLYDEKKLNVCKLVGKKMVVVGTYTGPIEYAMPKDNKLGTIEYNNGEKFICTWFEGKPLNNFGKMHYPNGNEYLGTWENGKFFGKGKYIDKVQKIVKIGHWKNNLLNGNGKEQNLKLKTSYEGNWKDGFYDGQGEYGKNKKLLFKGKFKKGLARIEGSYKNGELSEKLFKNNVTILTEPENIGPKGIFAHAELTAGPGRKMQEGKIEFDFTKNYFFFTPKSGIKQQYRIIKGTIVEVYYKLALLNEKKDNVVFKAWYETYLKIKKKTLFIKKKDKDKFFGLDLNFYEKGLLDSIKFFDIITFQLKDAKNIKTFEILSNKYLTIIVNEINKFNDISIAKTKDEKIAVILKCFEKVSQIYLALVKNQGREKMVQRIKRFLTENRIYLLKIIYQTKNQDHKIWTPFVTNCIKTNRIMKLDVLIKMNSEFVKRINKTNENDKLQVMEWIKNKEINKALDLAVKRDDLKLWKFIVAKYSDKLALVIGVESIIKNIRSPKIKEYLENNINKKLLKDSKFKQDKYENIIEKYKNRENLKLKNKISFKEMVGPQFWKLGTIVYKNKEILKKRIITGHILSQDGKEWVYYELIRAKKNPKTAPIKIIFGGDFSSVTSYLDYILEFSKKGFNVITLGYRGEGLSSQVPDNYSMQNYKSDALWLYYVVTRQMFPENDIIVLRSGELAEGPILLDIKNPRLINTETLFGSKDTNIINKKNLYKDYLDFLQNHQVKKEIVKKRLPKGRMYEGQVNLYGKPFGKGKLYKKNKVIYDGYFYNGKKYGRGTIFNKKSIKISEGAFKNDKLDGYGKRFNPKGVLLYEGYWKKDSTNGKGKFFFSGKSGKISSDDFKPGGIIPKDKEAEISFIKISDKFLQLKEEKLVKGKIDDFKFAPNRKFTITEDNKNKTIEYFFEIVKEKDDLILEYKKERIVSIKVGDIIFSQPSRSEKTSLMIMKNGKQIGTFTGKVEQGLPVNGEWRDIYNELVYRGEFLNGKFHGQNNNQNTGYFFRHLKALYKKAFKKLSQDF